MFASPAAWERQPRVWLLLGNGRVDVAVPTAAMRLAARRSTLPRRGAACRHVPRSGWMAASVVKGRAMSNDRANVHGGVRGAWGHYIPLSVDEPRSIRVSPFRHVGAVKALRWFQDRER